MTSSGYLIVLLLSVSLTAGEIKNVGWWKNIVIYEIYPRSFVDSNNDGIGDLNGITSKLDHFVESGIGAIWLTPIYASPMIDFGYDISDFKSIDPMFGTMADFDELMKRAKELGLKVIMDLVPNHTSDKHDWFQRAIAGDLRYKDYYIWREGRNNNTEPPNNWISVFGGSAWTYHNQTNQWYLHQFLNTQPDLNYRHFYVQLEMKDIIKFWLDKGVDGFRVDAIMYLFEADSFQDEPKSNFTNVNETDYSYLDHIYTMDDPRTYEEVQSWRQLLDNYSNQTNQDQKLILTEAYTTLDNTVKYYKYGSDVPFNFQLIENVTASSSPEDFKNSIDSWLNAMPSNATANWVMGNHDMNRTASRYPGRADQMTMLAMILPGVAVTYNGEEIGMANTQISWNDTRDPVGCSVGEENYERKSRDPARTPFQWNNTTNAGFNRGAKPWLPINENYVELNLLNEKVATVSHYKVYQSLTKLRRTSLALRQGSYRSVVLNDKKVLAIIREYNNELVILLVNFNDNETQLVNLSNETGRGNRNIVVEVASVESAVKLGSSVDLNKVKLPGKAALVLISSRTSSAFTMSPLKFVLILTTIIALVSTRDLFVSDLQ